MSNKNKEENVIPTKTRKIGRVQSRNDYPTNIKHKGEITVISPRGSTQNDISFDDLEELSPGLCFIENK